MIEERQKARTQGFPEEEKRLNKVIKIKANQDRQNANIATLEQAGTLKERWRGVNQHRKSFTPNFNQQLDMEGKRIKFGQRAEATAEYLEKKQWGNVNNTQPKPNPGKVHNQQLNIDCGCITRNELDCILKKLKKDKAPGPDKAITELFKWLDSDNRDHLLGILNLCWSHEYVPDATLEANVASIFKKGDTKKLENYRPISLLTTFYKIIASVIQARLATGLDHIVQPTQ